MPNLEIVETVDSLQHAQALQTVLERSYPNRTLQCFIQVNTSGEDAKHGVSPDDLEEVFQQIVNTCSQLKVMGLMTIGSVEQSKFAKGENADFKCLLELKDRLESSYGTALELSMGMTSDFEEAVSALI